MTCSDCGGPHSPGEPCFASHLSQSDEDTDDPNQNPNHFYGMFCECDECAPEWPSIEEQLEYWKTHDHGGNVLPSRIAANEERYQ